MNKVYTIYPMSAAITLIVIGFVVFIRKTIKEARSDRGITNPNLVSKRITKPPAGFWHQQRGPVLDEDSEPIVAFTG